LAQTDKPQSPAGRISIHQISIAFIASASKGGGSLSYHGRVYPFSIGGLGVGGFGASRLDAVGAVYNLQQLSDFNGVYLQIRSGWAAGEAGRGLLWLRNPNGVILSLKAQRRGLALTLGADGMLVRLKS
jgi:hypothetical protein